jgi:predicted ATPase/class 3 adenylate cyclase
LGREQGFPPLGLRELPGIGGSLRRTRAGSALDAPLLRQQTSGCARDAAIVFIGRAEQAHTAAPRVGAACRRAGRRGWRSLRGSGILSVVSDLPTGTVTFLFTDIAGSTKLVRDLGAEAYAHALAEHRKLLRAAFTRQGGAEVDTQGDAFFVAFPTAPGALQAAADALEAFSAGPVRVRVGIHTGTPLVTEEGYVGVDVHRAARIAAAAHGGQVLVSASTAALVDMLQLHDLGEHRLKDLSAPERIYQLGEGDFPPLKSLYRTNLPVPSTPFLGRAHELAEVSALLSRADVRLLTLTGPGGAGKTRLALQAAASQADRFADGIWWVPLVSLREPHLVLEEAAHALESEDGLAEHIADKRLLLLFDNFEHVAEAAPNLGDLLVACPNLEVLVTSRERLRLAGEREYRVPPLAENEAVALFIERAISALPDEHVRAICQRLDCLPLAVELAAARTTALSPKQILERLEQRLPLLTGGPRDAPERQQTLRATIEWSYELLSGDEQELFARLAVFSSGCTLEAAEQVCDADLDTLQSLVEKSLVRHTNERYWMLETIREFAGKQLAQAEEYGSTAAAHAEYFTALAERAEPRFGTSDEPTWMGLLAHEHDNVRAALAYSDRTPRQLRLVSALWRFWEQQGHYREGRRWLGAALARREGAPPTHVAGGLLGAGVLARLQGDFDEAERLMNESIAVARGAGLRLVEARAVGSLGNVALTRRDFRRGAELLAETQALFRELGDEKRLAITMNNRAYLALELGDFEAAFALADESRGLSRKMGDRGNVVSAGLNLSLAARSLRRNRTAKEALQEALELGRDLGHAAFLADALIVAAALISSGDPATAAALVAVADKARRDLMLELDPVERGVRAEVESELSRTRRIEVPEEICAGDVPVVLDAAADRALESLATLPNGSAT